MLRDLKERLAKTRWPDAAPGDPWELGVPLGYVKELTEYWQTKYDWRKQEQALNQLGQFITTIDGMEIHFMHVRSKHTNALPLLLVHGWPGSFVEFSKVIGPFTEPEKHGGKAADAFHVVIPSLVGFGFSGKQTERGWSSQRMAEVFAKLMARLGYERYGAQGGDWGGGIVRWIAGGDGGHCVGAHNNFPSGSMPTNEPMKGVTQLEMDRMTNRRRELNDHYGYASIQSTRPQTLGYGLNDSPAGLAAWITDKFWAWSDHGGKLENSFSKDDLLNNIMIYWVTQSMPSSARIYFESSHNAPRPSTMTPWANTGRGAPMGYALFPKEINVPPRAWIERANGQPLFHWTEFPKGGHFAALETPDLLVQDVREFFRKVKAAPPK